MYKVRCAILHHLPCHYAEGDIDISLKVRGVR